MEWGMICMKNTARQGQKMAISPVTTPFDMTVLNDLDRFHIVMDTIACLPEIRNWKWSATNVGTTA
jgi:phosphoketolase